MEEGMTFVEELGFTEIIERGTRAANDLRNELVYAGFSLGALPAQKLAQTRAGSRGALLFTPVSPSRNSGRLGRTVSPVQIHAMDAEPIFTEDGDLEAARELVASAEEAQLFLYPGNQHYFADASLPSYDEAATALLIQRVLSFLDRR